MSDEPLDPRTQEEEEEEEEEPKEEQEEEEAVPRAALTPASSMSAAQGVINSMLHPQQRDLQVKDVQDQQKMAQATAQRFTSRGQDRTYSTPHAKKDPSTNVSSHNAQQGSHGLSGVGPK